MFQQERQKNDGKKNKSIAQFGEATSRCILMCHHCNGNTTLSCKAGLCDTGGEDATVCFFKSRWGYEVNTNNTGEDLALFEKIRLRPLLISITLTQPPPPLTTRPWFIHAGYATTEEVQRCNIKFLHWLWKGSREQIWERSSFNLSESEDRGIYSSYSKGALPK